MKLNNSTYSHPKNFVSKTLEKEGNLSIYNKNPRTKKKKEILFFQKSLLANFASRENICVKKRVDKILLKYQKFFGVPLIKNKRVLNIINLYKK